MTGSNSGNDTPKENNAGPAASDRIQYGDQAAHLAFQRQLSELLERADITEEQRQQLLIAATCPCCGAGGFSISLQIKTDGPPRF